MPAFSIAQPTPSVIVVLRQLGNARFGPVRSGPSNETPIHKPGRFSIGLREAHVRFWNGASEEEGQEVGGTGWSADIESRASVGVGRRALAVIEE